MFENNAFKEQQIQILTGGTSASAQDSNQFGLRFDEPEGYLRLERITLGQDDAIVSRVRATSYSGEMRDDAYFTFVMQRAGRYDIQISGQDYGMSAGSLMAFRPNERRTRVRAGKTGERAAATLQVPIARMHRLAHSMETSTKVLFPRDGVALGGQGGLTLARVLPQLADDLFLRPGAAVPARVVQGVRHLIDEVLCEMMGKALQELSSRRVFPAFHRVRQAEDMMHAHSDEPMSILQVAERLDVSLRSLQLAFAEVHDGLSPRDVLNRIRLEKARQRLLRADAAAQVTTVAMDSGFFHLGRFSQAYARAFGEKPSETLARRRA